MKLINTFLWLYCILTFSACKNNSSKVQHLSLTPSSIIQDTLFTQIPGALILCGDHYLVWEDPFNPEKFLHIIDINTRREIKAIGEFGRGPKEFITPLSIKSIGNKIFTYDLNQDKQAYYSIDSLLVMKDPFILLPSLPIEDCLDIVQIAEGEFISTHPQNEQLFQWIHQDSTVSFFGKSPIKEKLKDYYNSRQGTLSYNPYNQKLIYSARLFPYIALYEKEGNNFQLKWEKTSSKNFYEIKNGDIHFIEEALVPHEIILTKDYIIPVQIYKERLYFTQAFNNETYQISKDTLLFAYEWNFGKYTYNLSKMKLPDLTTPEEQIKFYNEVMYSPKIPYTFNLNSQNDQYYYCSLFMKNKMLHVFYNKATKETTVFSTTKEKIGIYPFCMDNEKIIGMTDEDLMPIASLIDAKSACITNPKALTDRTENSKPVLVKYYFK